MKTDLKAEINRFASDIDDMVYRLERHLPALTDKETKILNADYAYLVCCAAMLAIIHSGVTPDEFTLVTKLAEFLNVEV